MGGLMMKMVKSAILATAGMFAVAGTGYAADLPVRKAPEKVFVEVCTNYEGFYRIPGTDTCVRIGGYVRMDWGDGGGTTSTPNFVWSRQSGLSNQFTRWVMVFDARPMTNVGPARIYANIIAGNVTSGGAGYTGGTPWTGADQHHHCPVGLHPTARLGVRVQLLDLRLPAHAVSHARDGRRVGPLDHGYPVHRRHHQGIAGDHRHRKFWRSPSADPGPWNVGSAGLCWLAGLPGPPNVDRTGDRYAERYPAARHPRRRRRRLGGQVIVPEIVGRLQYRGAWGDIAFMGALHEVRPAYSAPALRPRAAPRCYFPSRWLPGRSPGSFPVRPRVPLASLRPTRRLVAPFRPA